MDQNLKGPLYLRSVAKLLKISKVTECTALNYYHRCTFFLSDSTKNQPPMQVDPELLAATCLHLACKQTEVPRKVRDIVNCAYYVSKIKSPPNERLLKIDDRLGDLKDSIVTMELAILRILQFKTNVYTPLTYIPVVLHALDKENLALKSPTWKPDTVRTIAERSIAIASDAYLFSSLAVPKIDETDMLVDHAWNLALASLYIACNSMGVEIREGFDKWCESWGTHITPQLVSGIVQKLIAAITKLQAIVAK